MFIKFKDIVTLGNVLGGLLCVIFVIQGDIKTASYMIFLAYVFDVLDGVAARVTKQYNKFGSELDNVADLVSYSIAPAFLIYGYYTMDSRYPALPMFLAIAVGAMPAFAGCLRFARYNVMDISYEGAWLGFPRPASALLFIGYFNASFYDTSAFFYYLGILVVGYASYMHFVMVPFYNHHTKHTPYMLYSFFILATTSLFALVADLFFDQNTFFNIAAIWLILYLVAHRPLSFSKKELKSIDEFVKRIKVEETKMINGGSPLPDDSSKIEEGVTYYKRGPQILDDMKAEGVYYHRAHKDE